MTEYTLLWDNDCNTDVISKDIPLCNWKHIHIRELLSITSHSEKDFIEDCSKVGISATI